MSEFRKAPRLEGEWLQTQSPFSGTPAPIDAGTPRHPADIDRDLAAVQERRPHALPRLADDQAHAVALVAADLVLVGAVEDVVRKRQHVA